MSTILEQAQASQVFYLAGSLDPTVTAIDAPKYGYWLDVRTGKWYQKQDNGLSTNWQFVPLGGFYSFKTPCRLATQGPHGLSGLANIDGVAPVAGDRILVKAQGDAKENGIYIAATGAWSRSADFDESAEVMAGALVPIEEGTADDDTIWMVSTNNPITVGVTAINFILYPTATALSSIADALADSTVQGNVAGNTASAAGAMASGGTAGATTASGIDSHAEGTNTLAQGADSHAEGRNNNATADHAHAEGIGNTASQNGAHAEGSGCLASGLYSHAEGNATQATDYAAHAEGDNTRATSSRSHAEGRDSRATGFNAHAEGYNSLASGVNSHAQGLDTTASNNQAHAEGESTNAWGQNSHAEGYDTRAQGNQSHSEGRLTLALANNSHCEGENTTTSGQSSHAEGYNTEAQGQYSHAEGSNTDAQGQASHAEGDGCVSTGNSSNSKGRQCQARRTAEMAHGGGQVTSFSDAFYRRLILASDSSPSPALTIGNSGEYIDVPDNTTFALEAIISVRGTGILSGEHAFIRLTACVERTGGALTIQSESSSIVEGTAGAAGWTATLAITGIDIFGIFVSVGALPNTAKAMAKVEIASLTQ